MEKNDEIIQLLKEIRDNQKTQIEAYNKAKSFNVKLYILVLIMSAALYYLTFYFVSI